ncbi:MAG: hypothetical protein IJV35_06720 [Neisseriaceae bacterium]|nr:hypothetical protein [Neisseriaceae bacterium]
MVIIHNIERKCKLFSSLEKEVCFLGRNNEVCDDDMGFCMEQPISLWHTALALESSFSGSLNLGEVKIYF